MKWIYTFLVKKSSLNHTSVWLIMCLSKSSTLQQMFFKMILSCFNWCFPFQDKMFGFFPPVWPQSGSNQTFGNNIAGQWSFSHSSPFLVWNKDTVSGFSVTSKNYTKMFFTSKYEQPGLSNPEKQTQPSQAEKRHCYEQGIHIWTPYEINPKKMMTGYTVSQSLRKWTKRKNSANWFQKLRIERLDMLSLISTPQSSTMLTILKIFFTTFQESRR